MNMASYCKSQGMNLQQYKTFQENIINTATAIIQQIKSMYKTDTGVYYPINKILSHNSNADMKLFIIQELKNQGVEFFDNIESGNGEPWDYYKKRTYDNIDEAMSLYMIYLVRSDILDVKLFEELILDGETIQERYIEPINTTAYCIKTAVEKSLYDNNRSLINENESLKNNNELFNAFIKKYNVEKAFHEFIKTYENEVKSA